MDNLSNIRLKLMSSMTKLKREWNTVREVWKDAKAAEYENKYLRPIVMKQKAIAHDLETLEKITIKLKNLGVDI